MNAFGVKVGKTVLCGIEVYVERRGSDDVAGVIVWRKVETLIDMCRAADRITLLGRVQEQHKEVLAASGICSYRYCLSKRIESTILLKY